MVADTAATTAELDAAAQHWHEHGYVLIPAYLAGPELDKAAGELNTMYPTADEFHDATDAERNQALSQHTHSGLRPFPFASTELCLLSVHDRIIDLAEAILGSQDLRLYGCYAWAKYTGATSYEQGHHRDFSNHTPLVPTSDARYEGLEIFVWLNDVDEALGPAHVVSKTHYRDLPLYPTYYTREENPALYEKEVSAVGPAGTVLAYGTQTFHRGTELTAPRGARYALHVEFCRPENIAMTRVAWGDQAALPEWRPFVERATLRQLSLFGFPPPGHEYWTDEALEGMANRYPGLDLTPWR